MTIKELFTIDTFEKYKLDGRELAALKNVIELAKERLWLADSYPRRPEPSFDFEEQLEEQQIKTCRDSIDIILKAVHRYNTND